MTHHLRCRCGALRGMVTKAGDGTRAICYCRDCQAYAHALGEAGSILDANGGTEVVWTRPDRVSFTAGRDELACLRLTENGLMRWYARCCNTPIGNTSRNSKLAFVGLVCTCLGPEEQIEYAFGPVRYRVNTKSAKGNVQSSPPYALAFLLLRFGSLLLRARVDGSYRNTPFFDANGTPIATPRVLTRSERDRAMNAV